MKVTNAPAYFNYACKNIYCRTANVSIFASPNFSVIGDIPGGGGQSNTPKQGILTEGEGSVQLTSSLR